MPTTIASVFAAADLEPSGVVRWGERVPIRDPGVYVVGLTDDPFSLRGVQRRAPVSPAAIRSLLTSHPGAKLDGRTADPDQLAARIAAFWLPDEVIAYIGLATRSVQRRVDQFYRTPLGARSPHAGGWFLKVLDTLDGLFVHYAVCDDPDAAEDAMLRAFSTGVSAKSLARLHDPNRPIPFANLEWPKGRAKKHGIRGVKDARTGKTPTVRPKPTTPTATIRVGSTREAGDGQACQTQDVSENDIGKGEIRIRNLTTRQLFPAVRDQVEVQLRGERFTCRWDPRGGPKNRSGILGIGRERARRLLSPNEPLAVRLIQGVVHLD